MRRSSVFVLACWSTAVAGVLALSGCSALRLGDVERCDADNGADQCAQAFNAELGYPPSCRPFQCVDGLCVLDEQGEVCDGADNDCDGDVDEGVFGASESEGVGYSAGPVTLAVVSSGERVRAVWAEDDSSLPGSRATTRAVDLPVVAGSETAAVRHRRRVADDGGSMNTMALGIEPGCWSRTVPEESTAPPVVAADSCNIVHLAAAGAGTSADAGTPTITASLDLAGTCPSGQLRLSEVDPLEPARDLHDLGPLGRSNSFVGVSLTEDGSCSAARPAACQAALDATGGAAPAVVNCPDGTCAGDDECVCGRCLGPLDQAVARDCGFVSLSVAAAPSPGSAADVAAHGVVAAVAGSAQYSCPFEDLPETPADESLRDVALFGAYLHAPADGRFLNATDEGAPRLLGQTRGVGAPAVLGLEASFVVAYPDPTGGLAVHVVAALTDPESQAAGSCETLATDDQVCGAAGDLQEPLCAKRPVATDEYRGASAIRQCIATPPLPTTVDETVDGFARPFDYVVMEPGPAGDDSLLVGVAWLEQADGASTSIGFRTVELRTSGTPTVLGASPPITLTAAPGSYRPPTLAYLPTGFRAGDGVEAGGWYVIWAAGGNRLELQRVAAEDGAPIDPEPVAIVSRESGEVPDLPRAYTIAEGEGRGAGVVYVNRGAAAQIVSATLACPPR